MSRWHPLFRAGTIGRKSSLSLVKLATAALGLKLDSVVVVEDDEQPLELSDEFRASNAVSCLKVIMAGGLFLGYGLHEGKDAVATSLVGP